MAGAEYEAGSAAAIGTCASSAPSSPASASPITSPIASPPHSGHVHAGALRAAASQRWADVASAAVGENAREAIRSSSSCAGGGLVLGVNTTTAEAGFAGSAGARLLRSRAASSAGVLGRDAGGRLALGAGAATLPGDDGRKSMRASESSFRDGGAGGREVVARRPRSTPSASGSGGRSLTCTPESVVRASAPRSSSSSPRSSSLIGSLLTRPCPSPATSRCRGLVCTGRRFFGEPPPTQLMKDWGIRTRNRAQERCVAHCRRRSAGQVLAMRSGSIQARSALSAA